MVGPRRRAREIALQILTQMDVSPELDARNGIRLYFDHLGPEAEEEDVGAAPAIPAAPFDRKMVDALVEGVATHRGELDEIVQGLSRNWRLERMALVERNVIRLALYELKFGLVVSLFVVLVVAFVLLLRFGFVVGV